MTDNVFDGIPFVVDPRVPDGLAYLINTNYLEPGVNDWSFWRAQEAAAPVTLEDINSAYESIRDQERKPQLMIVSRAEYEARIISYGHLTMKPKEVNMSFKTDVRDLGERIGWTFAEAFLAVFVITDTSTLRTAAVAAAAAAIVPVKEFVKAHRAAKG